jgi:GNAT superfamily N-acetyltransferase
MSAVLVVRGVRPEDYQAWFRLWTAYGEDSSEPVAADVTETTWAGFLDPTEPMHCLVAEVDGYELAGLVHFLYHRDTRATDLVCYIADVFTAPELRGRGVGRALVEGVYDHAKSSGSPSAYWLTHETNMAARALYDQIATNFGYVAYEKRL